MTNEAEDNPVPTVDASSAVVVAKDRVRDYSHLIGLGDPDRLDPLGRIMLADRVRQSRREGNTLKGDSVAFNRGVCMS